MLIKPLGYWKGGPLGYWKGGPFQGLRIDSSLAHWNELSKETHMLTQQEILLWRWGAPGQGNPGEHCCQAAHSLGFYSHVGSFPDCLWPIVLLVLIYGPIQGSSWGHTHLFVRWFLAQEFLRSWCVYAKSLQSCLTLCDPVDCSLPGSSVHGILHTGILERVTISFSRGSYRPRDLTRVSYSSCIGGQVLYHCVTWEALGQYYGLMSPPSYWPLPDSPGWW